MKYKVIISALVISLVGGSVLAFNEPTPVVVQFSEIGEVKIKELPEPVAPKEDVVELAPVVQETTPIVQSTPIPVAQEPVEAPKEKTIEEIADTLTYSRPEHKVYLVACANVYEVQTGFKDLSDGTREQNIVGFLSNKAGYLWDGTFEVNGVLCRV